MWTFFDKYGQERVSAVGAPYIGVISRVTSPVTVNNTVAETNLLGITVPANALGTNGLLRITIKGDILNNTGTQQFGERLKVKLGSGATVVLDTGSDASNNGGSKVLTTAATRRGWLAVVEIMNHGATNSQVVSLDYKRIGGATFGSGPDWTVGEGAWYGGNISVNGEMGWGVNTSAIDTTVAMPIQFSVINPVANTLMETKLISALAEIH